ncbi:MAG: AMP-binding protein [Bacillota bacterium]
MNKVNQSKRWHKSYKLGRYQLAQSLAPYPELPLFTILDESASGNPLATAIDYYGMKLNYEELKNECDSLAAALAQLGLKRGDKVVTILPTCPQYIISTFAILKTGAAHVPCGNLHQGPELQYQINESGAETVIGLAEHLSCIESIKPTTKIRNIILTSLKDYTAEQPGNLEPVKGIYQFRQLIAAHKPQPPEVEIDPKNDLAYLAFTGGATGRPRGVMLTHYNRLSNVLQGLPWTTANHAESIRGRASVIIAVPLFHLYGDWVMLTAIYLGFKIILVQDPRDIDSILELMVEKRPFMVSIVPTQLMKLCQKDIPTQPVHIMSGSSYLPVAVCESVSQKTRKPVSDGYGLTEASPVTHIDLTGFSKTTGCIGVPVPDTDVKLINEETGLECAVGEAGHMYIKGPQVMKGYWPNPGDGLTDGWLPTGDIARMNEDGCFFIVDRLKDMVNISGYKVYTSVIDDILFRHPAVSMAVSIGVPDPERPGSERIKAFIQLKEQFKNKVSATEIISYCKKKCPPYAVPKFVEFREHLPLTATQKLFKRKLREEEMNKAAKGNSNQ